ncbi:LacI family DNA-binding transcriptional regulator [Actinocorallia longicatena]|uniref:LacI family DNA-binding transcriptional regulator n=1 Tax=Actinocorallia longicatena TaxID=111803 RepID=A0ABP6PYH6_9ACTN
MSAEQKPTLESVAARAGVGRGTVSRVINGSPKVSPQAREAVLLAIDELGYVPNRAARMLVTRRTDTVALVVSESEERVWGEPFFAGIIRGISAGLSETGLQLLLAMAQSPADHDRLERYLTGQHVDGALLVSLHGDDPLPGHLEDRGLPIVMVGSAPGYTPVAYVDADNRGGARLAVQHLADRGRRRIATITGPQDMQVGVDRLEGYRDVNPGPELIAHGDFSEDSGEHAMRDLLAKDPGLDAVYAASDPMAIGAMRVLREAGRRIPEDVAVVGFDDSPTARHTDPPLTSVHQPVEAMGRAMSELLIARIQEIEFFSPRILDTHLVVRGSS